jgi:hypothetical protein
MRKLTPKEQETVRDMGGWVRELSTGIQEDMDKLGKGYITPKLYMSGQRDMAYFIASLLDPQSKEGIDILDGILDTIPSLSEIVLPAIRSQAKIMMAAEDKIMQTLKVMNGVKKE